MRPAHLMHDQTDCPFPHLKFDVYRVALELLRAAKSPAERLPRGWAPLGDPLERAAVNTLLNVGEGSNRHSKRPGCSRSMGRW